MQPIQQPRRPDQLRKAATAEAFTEQQLKNNADVYAGKNLTKTNDGQYHGTVYAQAADGLQLPPPPHTVYYPPASR